MDFCPECGFEYNATTNRLIKEGCGHDKCRQCLLTSESGCPQCPVELLEEVAEEEAEPQEEEQQVEEYYVEEHEINEIAAADGDEDPATDGKFEIYWEVGHPEEHPEQEEIEAEQQQEEQELEEIETHFAVPEEAEAEAEEVPEKEPETIAYADPNPEPEPEPTKSSKPRSSRPAKTKSATSPTKQQQQRTAKTETAVAEQETARRKKPFTEENMPSHLRKLEPKPGSRACYECTICQKQLARTTFAYHVYCDPSIPKPFTCDQCYKSFRTADHFRYHANTHEAEEVSYGCESCDKTFRNKTTLATHFRQTHSGIPAPFACNTCEKTFFSAAKYKIHEDMHNDVLPYACEMCSRRFRLKENMLKHVNITHAQTKPFACQICAMTFKRIGSYRKHMERSHSEGAGPKQIWCNVCGKGFTHATMLRRHEREHLQQVEEYLCKLCTVKCTRRDNMMRHMRMMHFEGEVVKWASLEEHMVVVVRMKGADGEYELVEEVIEEVEEDEAQEEVWRSDEEEEEEEEEQQQEQEMGQLQERKSSVIIYVGAQGKTGVGSQSKRRRGGPSRDAEGSGSKRSRPEVVDDFATISSDKMEIYRKILMPSRDYYAVEEEEVVDAGAKERSTRRKRRERVEK